MSWIAPTSTSSDCTPSLGQGLLRHPRQVEHGRPPRHRVYSAPTDRSSGIVCDQTIALDGAQPERNYPEHLRRVRFRDPESGKTLVFITNHFTLPAATICALYKSRWQVELFFEWIKQHLRIKWFYGTSENAVKTQLWIAVSVYVLVAIIKNVSA